MFLVLLVSLMPETARGDDDPELALRELMARLESELASAIRSEDTFTALGASPTLELSALSFAWSCETPPRPAAVFTAFKLKDAALRWGAAPYSGRIFTSAPTALYESFAPPLGSLRQSSCWLRWFSPTELSLLPEAERASLSQHVYLDSAAGLCESLQQPERERGPGGLWFLELHRFSAYWRSDKGRVVAQAELMVNEQGEIGLGPVELRALSEEDQGTKYLAIDANGTLLCDTGESCYAYAHFVNAKLSRSFWERGCELGHGSSCFRLGRVYQQGDDDFPADEAKSEEAFHQAFSIYSKQCDHDDDAESCFLKGVMLEWGYGRDLDPKKATRAYKRACELSSKNGCFNLAGMRLRGKGTKQDDKGALEAYQRGCTLGDDEACTRADWFSECKDGDERACELLERMRQKS